MSNTRNGFHIEWDLHELGDKPAAAADGLIAQFATQVLKNPRPIRFRFGLSGRRWGNQGPVVLLLHGRETAPESLAYLIEPLVASGTQVIALDDPTDPAADESARATGFAYAVAEIAAEIGSHEVLVADRIGAAAAAKALRLAA